MLNTTNWQTRFLSSAQRAVNGARRAEVQAHLEECERQRAAEAEFAARCWAAAIGHLLAAALAH